MKEQNVATAAPASTAAAPHPRSPVLTSHPMPGATRPIGAAPSRLSAEDQEAGAAGPRLNISPLAPSLNAKPLRAVPSPAKAAGQSGPASPDGAKQPSGSGPAGYIHRVASAAKVRSRHLGLLTTFVAGVVLPTLVSAFYLFFIAEDQYASRLGFSVQREDASKALDILGGLTKLSGGGAPDQVILYKYTKSRDMLQAVAQKVDLKSAFFRSNDPIFSLDVDASIEDRTDYWERMVSVYLDSSSGLLELEVRAFTPETAQAIAVAILEESTRLLNELSDIAKSDATSYARRDLDQSVDRLKKAEQDLTDFRSRNQIVDPASDFQGRMGLLNSLLQQQAAALIELDLLRADANPNDPRRELAQRRIDVIGQRIAAERKRISTSDTSGEVAYADLVSEYERLRLEQDFAQRAYLATLASYNASLADAARASRYLATYLPPTKAEKSEYPQRFQSTLLIFGAAFLIWSILALTYYSIRDRR